MIIHLKSKLFTVAPEKRFAKEFNVDERVWRDCWIKYKVMGLTTPELCEYIQIRTGRKPSTQTIRRWIVKTEIYSMSKGVREMGITTVMSSFFKEYENDVVEELLRNMKYSGTSKTSNMA